MRGVSIRHAARVLAPPSRKVKIAPLLARKPRGQRFERPLCRVSVNGWPPGLPVGLDTPARDGSKPAAGHIAPAGEERRASEPLTTDEHAGARSTQTAATARASNIEGLCMAAGAGFSVRRGQVERDGGRGA